MNMRRIRYFAYHSYNGTLSIVAAVVAAHANNMGVRTCVM